MVKNVYDAYIGKRIKKFRKAAHLTNEQFAELLNISPVHLRRIEGGSRLPSLDLLLKISDILNILPKSLLSNDDTALSSHFPKMKVMSPEEIQIFIKIVKAFYK